MFNGYDFVYDGKSSISENVKILYTDSNPFEFTKSIPNREYNTFKTNQSGRWRISGVTTPEPLSFPIQIMVYSDDIDLYTDNKYVIDRNRISRISHWLFDSVNYKKLQIFTDDLRDLYFMVIFTDVEYFTAGGDVCGFRATIQCDTAGAYEEKIVKKTSSGSLTFNLQNLTQGSRITIDSETLIATSSEGDNLYTGDRFNKCFPVLTYGKNIVSVTGGCTLELNYRMLREVGC